MNAPIGKIEVKTTQDGFKVYGRMGAVLTANKAKEITYSNLNEDAHEYGLMVKTLKKA